MLETIRSQLMEWFVERRLAGIKMQTVLVPEVSKAMQALQAQARTYRFIQATNHI
jgi:hypothetical protein